MWPSLSSLPKSSSSLPTTCCGRPRKSPRICNCNSLGIRASSAALVGVKIIWNAVMYRKQFYPSLRREATLIHPLSELLRPFVNFPRNPPHHDVHPALVAFRNVIHVPFVPAEPVCF